MNKGFTHFLASALVLVGSATAFAADQTPMVTFTVEADGATKASFNLSSTLADGQDVQVDWGDGVLTEPVKVVFNDGGFYRTTFESVPKGNIIKVYGDQSTIYEVDASYKVGNLVMTDADFSALTDVKRIDIASNAFTSVDLSKCAALEDFRAASNKLTAINFGDINKIKRIELQNASATVGENRLGNVDLSQFADLTYLMLNFSEIETYDFSPFKSLQSAYFLGNNLSEADFSDCASIYTISLNNNPLKKLVLPAVSTKKATINLLNTYLDFAQMQSVIDFANQKNGRVNAATLIIPCEGNSRVIDLSAYYKHGDNISTFAWVDGAKQEIPATAYTAENGVFTFSEDFADAVCTVENASFTGRKFVTPPMKIQEPVLEPFMAVSVAAGEQKNLGFALSSTADGGQEIRVDWGDGVISDPVNIVNYNVDPYFTKFEAVPKGEVVKIYGDESTIYEVDFSWATGYAKIVDADCSKLVDVKKLNFASNAIPSIDITNCAALESFAANSAGISEIKFGNSPNLSKIELQNANATNGNNAISTIDLSTLPGLKTIYLSYNPIETIDFSNNPAMESFYMLGTKLASVDLSGCKNIKWLNFNYNPLTEMILPAEAVNKSKIFVVDTYLGFDALQKVADYAALKNSPLNASSLIIPCEGESDKIDLSAYEKHNGKTSVFVWKDSELAPIAEADFTMANGVFTFNKSFENAVCTVTNSAFPASTWKTLPVNIKADESGIENITASDNDAEVEYFDLRGVRVAGDQPGLYIRRHGSKVEKVIVK